MVQFCVVPFKNTETKFNLSDNSILHFIEGIMALEIHKINGYSKTSCFCNVVVGR